jgi:DNA-binding MurR/RpiR family transcriptional regulator
LLAIGRAKISDTQSARHAAGVTVLQNNKDTPPVSTRAEIAKIANVSPGTVAKHAPIIFTFRA